MIESKYAQHRSLLELTVRLLSLPVTEVALLPGPGMHAGLLRGFEDCAQPSLQVSKDQHKAEWSEKYQLLRKKELAGTFIQRKLPHMP